jgi:aspartyl-tRNA(Asn)/glutamyl-tRNA(Gln) amidotransferase subunit A
MSDTDVAFASLSDLGAILRKRSVSSLELTQLFMKRLERFGPRLNALAAMTRERALAAAKRADDDLAKGVDRGPLHGIPYGVKDLLAATGAPTAWGAQPYRTQVFDYDATVIKKLEAAGAVLIAKLAMIELAGGMGYNQADASYLGPCRNPWNTAYWTGGSSSGPGAAVAAGLVPFAIGSETSGSIVNPSTYCGLTGLRPTYGRVSRHGAMALSWTLDKVGPMCHSAQDAATVIGIIAGRDPADPTSSRRPPPAPPQPKQRWRLGVLKGATKKTQPEVAKNFKASLKQLQTIADIEEVSLPKYPYDAMIGAIIAAEGGAAFREIIQDGRVQTLRDPDGKRGGYSYMVTYAVDYVDAMRQRAPLRQAFGKLFARYDALVAPSFATVALPIGVPFDKAYPGTEDGPFIPACNLVGVPAVAVPNGTGRHGLPTGLSFVGRPFAESEMLALADRYQSLTSYHRSRPPLAR